MEQDHDSEEFLRGFRARRSGTGTRSESLLDSMKRPLDPVKLPLDPVKPARVQELEASLKAGDYQCITCLESIAQKDVIWSCKNCWNIFHLWCMCVWAHISTETTSSWTCPACREPQTTAADTLQHSSYCFCTRAMRNPPPDPNHTPHTCGGRCNKSGSCLHTLRCALPCHPGPCPPCNNKQSCPCGKTEAQCPALASCGQPCAKRLACDRHNCAQTCHKGACGACELAPWFCLCGKTSLRELGFGCAPGVARCQQPCGKLLACERHPCRVTCHVHGECSERVDHPYHPVPSCGQPCGKRLACGRHNCAQTCHEGPCGACELAPWFCLCGRTSLRDLGFGCAPGVARCQQPCGKLLACGRHLCPLTCHAPGGCKPQCSEGVDHPSPTLATCGQPCRKRLACDRHNCAQTCHEGACGACELDPWFCLCGRTSLRELGFGSAPGVARCQQPCGKLLTCGRHLCPFTCHAPGGCKPHCSERVDHPCQCGASTREDDCRISGEVYWCKRKACQKMRANCRKS